MNTKHLANTTIRRLLSYLLIGVFSLNLEALAQTERLSRVTNQSSQRYEINQTFDGQAYRRDNNLWVYTKEFADLFGMPKHYIEDVRGIAAAAFRIEDTSSQECGFGGNAEACRKVEECLLDLYFDESKNPLPWITNIKSQWLPWYSSMIWLRPLEQSERPHGVIAIEPPQGIIRNKSLHSEIIPFADPVSKVQAIFVSNKDDSTAKEDDDSGNSLAIIGYMRNYYQNLSIVSLQFGCSMTSRKTFSIRLESKPNGSYSPSIASFNRIFIPTGFTTRIRDRIKARSDRNAVFYRSLFLPPLGTKGTQNIEQTN